MRQKIDITMKNIIRDIPVVFLKLLTGFDNGKFLDSKLVDVHMGEVDLLIELPDGTIVHIEIQSYNDGTMLVRMYRYSSLIYKVHGKIPRQIVLYVGNEPMRMSNVLETEDIYYSYKLIDIKDIDCHELLTSSRPEDIILSVLCKTTDTDLTIKTILGKLSKLPVRKRQDYIRKLLYLSDLRKLSDKIQEEIKHMPITIDMEENWVFKRGRKAGLLEGTEKGLQKGLQKGLLEGLQDGLQKGLQEGLQKGLLEGIADILEIKYGFEGLKIMDMVRHLKTIDNLELFRNLLKQSTDINELKAFLKQILK